LFWRTALSQCRNKVRLVGKKNNGPGNAIAGKVNRDGTSQQERLGNAPALVRLAVVRGRRRNVNEKAKGRPRLAQIGAPIGEEMSPLSAFSLHRVQVTR
jgi:hypothetical protein